MEEAYLTPTNLTQSISGDEDSSTFEIGQCIFIGGIFLFVLVVIKIGLDVKSYIVSRDTNETNSNETKLNISSKDRRFLLEKILVCEIYRGDNDFESKLDRKVENDTEKTSATSTQDNLEGNVRLSEGRSCCDTHNEDISSVGSSIPQPDTFDENRLQSEKVKDIENCDECGEQAMCKDLDVEAQHIHAGNPPDCAENCQFESVDCRTMLLKCVKSIQMPRFEEQQDDETTDSSEDECSICLSEFQVGDEIMRAGSGHACTHKFHKNCLLSWLESHNLCPMCRFEMVKDSELEKAMKVAGITPLAEPTNV